MVTPELKTRAPSEIAKIVNMQVGIGRLLRGSTRGCGIRQRARTRTLAGGVLHDNPGVQDAAELQNAEQDQQQDRYDQDELDDRIAAFAPVDASAQAPSHRSPA